MTQVTMPKWWTETDHEVIGYTDTVDTYCCSTTPCWFVSVPEFEYEGYFSINDLKEVNNEY